MSHIRKAQRISKGKYKDQIERFKYTIQSHLLKNNHFDKQRRPQLIYIAHLAGFELIKGNNINNVVNSLKNGIKSFHPQKMVDQ